MIRATRLVPTILLAALTVACASPSGDTQPPTTPRVALTDTQVQRYINSYLPAHAIMSEYWGKRRYSPPDKMLAPPHTLDRAVEEMRAAGTLPDFELLLQSHGFDGVEAWKATGDRIAYAYMTIRLETVNPAHLAQQRETRKKQMASIAAHRSKLRAQDDAESRTELESIDIMQKQVERSLQAEADAIVFRPYYAKFDKLNQQAIEREK